jgi:hypothetical protein
MNRPTVIPAALWLGLCAGLAGAAEHPYEAVFQERLATCTKLNEALGEVRDDATQKKAVPTIKELAQSAWSLEQRAKKVAKPSDYEQLVLEGKYGEKIETQVEVFRAHLERLWLSPVTDLAPLRKALYALPIEHGDEHDWGIRAHLRVLRDINEVLSQVEDAASAKKAETEIARLGKTWRAVQKRAQTRRRPSEKRNEALQKKYGTEISALTNRFLNHVIRISQTRGCPDLNEIFRGLEGE